MTQPDVGDRVRFASRRVDEGSARWCGDRCHRTAPHQVVDGEGVDVGPRPWCGDRDRQGAGVEQGGPDSGEGGQVGEEAHEETDSVNQTAFNEPGKSLWSLIRSCSPMTARAGSPPARNGARRACEAGR